MTTPIPRRVFPLLIALLSAGIACSLLSQKPNEQDNKEQGHIAFVDPDGNIRVITPDLSENNVVLSGGGYFSPSWSPDGRKLAYIRNNAEIWVYDFDTEKSVMIHQEDQDCFANPECVVRILHWAYDNSGVYFHGGGGGPNWNHIKCVNVDGPSCDTFSLWSYPGFDISRSGRIVYLNFSNADALGYGLAIYDIHGAISRDLIPLLPDTYEHQTGGPSWSPDESQVALYIDGKLITVLSNGRGQTTLTEAKLSWNGVNPPTTSWSLDGSYIAYEDGGYIWIIDTEGKNSPHQVTQGSAPSWGP